MNAAAIKKKSRLGNNPASAAALLQAAERQQPMSEIGRPAFIDPVSLVGAPQGDAKAAECLLKAAGKVDEMTADREMMDQTLANGGMIEEEQADGDMISDSPLENDACWGSAR